MLAAGPRLLVLAILLALGGAATPAQIRTHRFRREAGLVHEALARVERAIAAETLTDEERNLALDALETALREGSDALTPVDAKHDDSGCRLRVPVRRLAARAAAWLPAGLEAAWNRRIAERAEKLLSSPDSLVRSFPASAAAGRARVARAAAALERGAPGQATFELMAYLEAFAHRQSDAPVPWADVEVLFAMAGLQQGDPGLREFVRGQAPEATAEVILGGEKLRLREALARVRAAFGAATERPEPADALDIAWEVSLRATPRALGALPLVVLRDRIIAVVEDQLIALGVADGARLWTRILDTAGGPDFRVTGLAGGDGVLVVGVEGAEGASLRAFDIAQGDELWTLEAPGPSPHFGAPAAAEGSFVVPVDLEAVPAEGLEAGRWLIGGDLASGRLHWRTLVRATETGDSGGPRRRETPPLIHRGLVVTATGPRAIVALALGDGSPRWSLEAPPPEGGGRDPRARHQLLARNGVISWRGDGISYWLTMLCDVSPWQDPASWLGVERWRPRGWSRALVTSGGPDVLALGLADPREARRSYVRALRHGRLPRGGGAPPAPLSGRALSAAVIPEGVFVTTGRYVYRIDPASGEPGNPLLSRESERPGPWLRLLSAPGGLIAVTPVSVALLRPSP